MAQRYPQLTTEHMEFVRRQEMFFIATAPQDGYVNLSPKGLDALRILDGGTVAWLNLTGSGNETAAHVLENGRMTLMFCAFSGKPLILRIYGKARAIHPRDPDWQSWLARFDGLAGARQIFVVEVELVQTSCGMGVPLYAYQGQREQLVDWAKKKGAEGLADYWDKKNQVSLDGQPTGIFAIPASGTED
jgi:hypothetical protein